MLIEVLEIEGKKEKPGVDDFMTGRYALILTEQASIRVSFCETY